MKFLHIIFSLFVFIAVVSPALSANYNKGLEAAQRGDLETALKEWRPLAEKGDVGSQFNMGLMYETGRGVLKDYKAAFNWYKRCAEQGAARAQIKIGVFYEDGLGVPKNAKTAFKWYALAADQGNVSAQNNLAILYRDGRGTTKSLRKSLELFLKSANKGSISAQFEVGVMYENGEGVRQDYKKSFKWFKKAADQGDPDAQYIVATKYIKGMGVGKNKDEAIKYMEMASAQGDEDATKLLTKIEREFGLKKDAKSRQARNDVFLETFFGTCYQSIDNMKAIYVAAKFDKWEKLSDDMWAMIGPKKDANGQGWRLKDKGAFMILGTNHPIVNGTKTNVCSLTASNLENDTLVKKFVKDFSAELIKTEKQVYQTLEIYRVLKGDVPYYVTATVSKKSQDTITLGITDAF